MSTYQDILDAGLDDPTFDQPPDTPIGVWRLQALSAKPKKGEDERNYVMFVYKPVEAQENVDAAELEVFVEADGLNTARLYHRMYFDRQDAWKVRRHLATFGVDIRGVTLNEALKGFKGYEAFAEVDHQQSDKDPDELYINTNKFAAV